MRILWFTNTPSGYLERHLNKKTIGGGWFYSLENELIKNEKIELAVAFLHNTTKKVKDKNITYYLIENQKKNVFQKIARQLKKHSLNKENIYRYLDVINDFKPDLIQIWGTEKDYGLVASKTTIPTVIHMQGIITPYAHKFYSSGITPFQIIQFNNFIDFIRMGTPIWGKRSYDRDAYRERLILKNVDYIIGRTFWDKYICKILAPQAKYYHNDEMLRDIFYTNSNKWSYKKRKKNILLTTSRGNIYKGFETILRTANLLKGQIDFEWRIIGVDQNNSIIKLFEKFTKIKIKNTPLIFLGNKTADEMVEEMKHADVFIHPSHIDNSPNSVCEAMILGMPVIASYAGGTGALLEDRKEGLLIQDGDPWALGGSILEIIQHPNKAIEYGNRASLRANNRHSKIKIIADLLNIYRSIENGN